MVLNLYENISSNGATDINTVRSSKLEKKSREFYEVLELHINDKLVVNPGDYVDFYDFDSKIIFKGIVKNIIHKTDKFIECYNYGIKLNEITVYNIWNNKKPEEILKDIIENHTPLKYSSNITSETSINIYVSKFKKVIDIIDDLTHLLSCNWKVENDTFFVNTFSSIQNELDLIDKVNCNNKTDGFVEDTSKLVSRVIMIGGSVSTNKEFFLSGTGSKKEYDISIFMNKTTIEHPLGTYLTPKLSETSSGDYFVDKNKKKIIFSSPPSSGTNNIKIYYEEKKTPKVILDKEGINPDNSNLITKTLERKFLKDIDSLTEYGSRYLHTFGDPIFSCEVKITDINIFSNFRVNQKVNYLYKGKTYSFIIKSITRVTNKITSFVTIKLSERDVWLSFFQLELDQRIKNLEEEVDTTDVFTKANNITKKLKVELNKTLSISKSDLGIYIKWHSKDSSATIKWYSKDSSPPIKWNSEENINWVKII